MTRPIARPANVPARTRRRQRPSSLLRSALLIALAVTCVFALPTVLESVRALRSSPAGGTAGGGGSGMAAGQVAMSGLQAGACMALAPRGGEASKTVFIDPGHGGLDPGVVGAAGGQQVLEKNVTLAVAMRLASLLQADGYRVVLARTADTSVTMLAPTDSVTGALTAAAEHRDLVTRAACANAADASVLLSLHFNAFDDPSVGGAETYYDPARPFSAENKRLASDLQEAVVAALGTSDRGVWTDDQLAAPTLTTSGSLYGHLIELGPAEAGWVDAPSRMPGALVEPLFLTNPAEARVASSPSGQQRIAVALQDGLNKFVGGA
ncbi:MAG TPA: N-acetylmuramoyl-L-alanine amidase [Candidatus Limnocylindrales bacterium]|nr:N-acetylmuramoyl-L-alanine amidase [Candidatus Limnocylindrales bacterium]